MEWEKERDEASIQAKGRMCNGCNRADTHLAI